MSLFSRKKQVNAENLGLGLPPGGDHYRAFVGPPEDYDLVSAMSFNLLTCLGLRQNHRLLDVGCGSLRVGRLLVPYLNAGNYTGIEPNGWLVDEGIRREIGADLVAIKKPVFHIADNAVSLSATRLFDFALAQSIFSHCGIDLFTKWLGEISRCLDDKGVLVATFLVGEEDCDRPGWIYPGCVYYKSETVAALAEAAGLRFLVLDWKHPRQTWALFYRPGFDISWIRDGKPSWNDIVSR